MKPKERYAVNAALLKTVRRQNKMSLRDVARQTGVQFSAIHRFEKGKPITVLHYIALMDFVTLHRRSY